VTLLAAWGFFHIRNGLRGRKGCTWFFEKGPDPNTVSATDYVEFERWGCFGPCPIYVVRIQANGAVRWRGTKFIAVLGDRTASVDPSGAKALIRSFLTGGFWSLCSSYEQQVSDSASWITTVHIGSREKRVLNYARSAPAWLDELDAKVDVLADTHRWRHGDPGTEKLDGLNVFEDAYEPKPGVTALMRSASHDDLAAVKDLLAHGADIEARDSSGWTALIYALAMAPRAVAEALINAGADTHARSFTGQTTLMSVAAGDRDRDEKIALLAENGDINAQDQNGETALMLATRSSYWRIHLLGKLLESGARRDLRDSRGQTAYDQVLAQGDRASADRDQVLKLLQPSSNPK